MAISDQSGAAPLTGEQIERFRAEWERQRHGRPRLLTPLPRRVRLLTAFLTARYDEKEQAVTDGDPAIGLPEAVLRDIALKRAILADTTRVFGSTNDLGAFRLAERTLRRLGTEFSGHPGYRQEWAP